MARCEDYPCCGHGPPPMGDGGGCPEVDGYGRERWHCVECGTLMRHGATSSICSDCQRRWRDMDPDEREERLVRDDMDGGW